MLVCKKSESLGVLNSSLCGVLGASSVHAPLLRRHAVGCAVHLRALLSRVLGDGQAVDAEVVADARDDEVRPATIHHGSEDEVSTQVPELEIRGNGAK